MYNMLYGLPGVINASNKYRNNILFFLSVNFLGVQSTVMLVRWVLKNFPISVYFHHDKMYKF